METVRGRDFEHSQMHRRILVPGEADVSNFPRLFRIHQGFQRPAGSEEAVGIFHPDVLVKLNQVDVIRLQSPQRFIDLPGRGVLRPAIEFSHQEHFLSVPVTERKPHAPLAFPIVVIPAVVHEGDAAVDRTADDANPFVRVLRATDVMAAQPDRRHFFVGVSEASIDHSVSLGLARRRYADARQNTQDVPSFHARSFAHEGPKSLGPPWASQCLHEPELTGSFRNGLKRRWWAGYLHYTTPGRRRARRRHTAWRREYFRTGR